MASTISASMIKAPVAARQQTALTQAKTAKPAMVSNVNAKKTNAFLVWTPTDNKVCVVYFACFCRNRQISGTGQVV